LELEKEKEKREEMDRALEAKQKEQDIASVSLDEEDKI